MSERGQMLDGLEDTVNSLRTGSENMLAQVGLDQLQVVSFHPLTTGIGEETCCRAVGSGLVRVLKLFDGRERMNGTALEGSRRMEGIT